MAFENYGPFAPPETVMSPIGGELTAPTTDKINLDSNVTPIRTFMGSPNLSAQFDQYKELANKLISPYNTMSQNSWLAQNHPGIAGLIDRISTVAALTPGPRGPEGVGEGISRTFQGLLGAQQLTRQKALESAMLPYQLMMPQLQAQNLMSEIGARESEIPYRHAMEQRALAQADRYEGLMEQGHIQPPQIDTKGQMWVPRTTSGGTVELWNPITHQKADPNNPPQFVGKLDRAAQEYGGGVMGRIIAEETAGITDPKARADAALKIMTGYAASSAGARTGAEQSAPHPQATAQELEQAARATIGKGINKPRANNPMEYLKGGFTTSLEDANKLYASDRAAANQQLANQQQWVDSYISSGASKKGTSFTDWMATQRNHGVAAPSVSTAEEPSTPSNSGSNWTPQ